MIVKKDLPEVHLLRGLASLMVAAYHLVWGNGQLFTDNNALKQATQFGYIGVEVFFILSGFVICYALPAFYRLEHYGTFLLKRIVRIEPPYIVSILLIVLLNSISYNITGTEKSTDWWNILAHFAYINNFGSGSYINVVYWTLGIEFQFYILIGLLVPFIKSANALLVLSGGLLLLSFLVMPSGISVILPYLSFFAIGILFYFYKKSAWISPIIFLGGVTIFLAQVFLFHGPVAFVASLFTVLILQYWKHSGKLIRFFSAISFSLYLIHVPVGGKVINLGLRYVESGAHRYILVVLAFVVSIAAAYIFYRLVEMPSLRLSKRIVYNKGLQPEPEVKVISAGKIPAI